MVQKLEIIFSHNITLNEVTVKNLIQKFETICSEVKLNKSHFIWDSPYFYYCYVLKKITNSELPLIKTVLLIKM